MKVVRKSSDLTQFVGPATSVIKECLTFFIVCQRNQIYLFLHVRSWYKGVGSERDWKAYVTNGTAGGKHERCVGKILVCSGCGVKTG